MSHLLRRTKKSCLKFLRKISTSKQLFVQRLDEDDEDEREVQQFPQPEEEHINTTAAASDKQYACNNNNSNNKNTNHIKPNPSVQYCEEAISHLNEKVEQMQQEEEEEEVKEEEPQLNVHFDLMHYKENVRYLRHTPTNSSSSSSLDLRQVAAPPQCSYSVSVGSQFDGQYHNVIIVEQPPNDAYPIVKWDINGNSLDEEQFDLRQHWAAFDSRWRQLQTVQSGTGKRLGSAQSQRSSHHSSSCTLETWIDDAELGLGDDSQNLLQSNNNKNNFNNCLKSF